MEDSGESPSVIRNLLADHPEWFEEREHSALTASTQGLAALAREMVARRALVEARSEEESALLDRLRELGRRRGRVKRELDQVWATPETVLARARRLVEGGDVQRGLLFLGDDDMTSLAVHLLGVPRRTTVVEVDPDLLRLYEEEAERGGWEHRSVEHDLRKPFPKAMRRRFGCVFTDPPYAPEGFALFVSRAIELLRPDGRLLVCSGQSRRSSERGLAKQRMLAEAGVLLEEVLPDFNTYEGARSIGSRSSLFIGRLTPQTRPLVTGEAEGPLYTRRSPDGEGDA